MQNWRLALFIGPIAWAMIIYYPFALANKSGQVAFYLAILMWQYGVARAIFLLSDGIIIILGEI